MNIGLTSLIRGVLSGIASGGGAFLVLLIAGDLPARVHAWALLALTVFFAVSESYFKSLLSELSALLRRGTYSVWQLEQLGQTVPLLRKRISFVWALSMWLKAAVGVVCAFLLWDGMPARFKLLTMFFGYTCLFYSMFFAMWGRRNFRLLEKTVDELTLKEAGLKERRRLIQGIESGPQHDFENDKLAKGYTSPPHTL